jgi:hypothetical protein
MKKPTVKRPSTDSVAPAGSDAPVDAVTAADVETVARDPRRILASVARRVTGALGIARSGARMLVGRVPGTVHATQTGARDTTSALQRLPDSTLRWLAATSVGLGAGLYFTGAPRVIIAAGIAPALMMGAAIALRPIAPARWPNSSVRLLDLGRDPGIGVFESKQDGPLALRSRARAGASRFGRVVARRNPA